MFRFTQEPPSGNHSQCLSKIVCISRIIRCWILMHGATMKIKITLRIRLPVLNEVTRVSDTM
jgi:hypothetical protein